MKKKIVMAILMAGLLGACAKKEEGSVVLREDPYQTENTGGNSEVPKEETGTSGSTEEKGFEEANASAAGDHIRKGSLNLSEEAGQVVVCGTGIEAEDIEAVSRASLALFANTIRREMDNDPGTNVLISPTSVQMALGMTANGARGDTLKQMEEVIASGMSIDRINPFYYELREKMMHGEDVDWNVANSIWFRNDGLWEMKPDFLAAVKTYYDADIWLADFDEQTVADINEWIKQETYGMIPKTISRLSPDDRMLLINAIAFEGEWENEYEEYDIEENSTFRNADGTTSDVTMLYSNEDRYFTVGEGIGFIRPYKGGEYSFVGILPEEGVSPAEFVEDLYDSGVDLSEEIRNATYYDRIYVRIPEFELDYDILLNDVLHDMGMTDAFSSVDADFGEMMQPVAETVDDSAWIGSVLHKTHIEVNREGTRAAAVTVVTMENCAAAIDYSLPLEITLDRPFVYAIVDNDSGLPIFLGTINSIE